MKSLAEEWFAALPELQSAVPFDLATAAKVVFRVGSHSHGTYVPPEDEFGIDDVDMMVICVPPPEHVLGLHRWEHSEYKVGRLDVVFYDWGKWLHMMMKSNPNVIGTLWLRPEDVLDAPRFESLDPFHTFDILRNNRDLLLTKQMYPAFVGYAQGQLHKMTHHAHQGYMGEKRKRLVERFGYDVKNAAHLVRLLRMACEAFETNTLTVYRPDAADLIAIKTGQWSRDQVLDEANALFQRAASAHQNSSLVPAPDTAFIERMMVQGYARGWGWKAMEWE